MSGDPVGAKGAEEAQGKFAGQNLPDQGNKMSRDEEIIPLVEESARIDKREVQTRRVQVHTVVETSEQMVREALSSRNVKVTRVPVDQPVTTLPEIRTENGVTIVPVLEEVLVVEKRLILKEEVHIEQELSHETVEVPVTLRKQRAVVERLDAEDRPITEKA